MGNLIIPGVVDFANGALSANSNVRKICTRIATEKGLKSLKERV